MTFLPTTIFFMHALFHACQSEVVRVTPYTTNSCPNGQGFQNVRAKTEVVDILNSCRAEDGWRKILDIDMSNPSDSCPEGLTLYTNPFRLCGRTQSNNYDFCNHSIIAVNSQFYTKVCGRIKGYQENTEYSFWGRTNIEQSYLDGVSLTYGPSGTRQHIWSFVTASNTAGTGTSYCPLPGANIPSFITNDYFCDSGAFPNATTQNGVYVDHPLWDGVPGGCDGDSNIPPRCYVNSPPWFHKTLPAATNRNIELRLCGYSNVRYGDTLIEEIELYIQ